MTPLTEDEKLQLIAQKLMRAVVDADNKAQCDQYIRNAKNRYWEGVLVTLNKVVASTSPPNGGSSLTE